MINAQTFYMLGLCESGYPCSSLLLCDLSSSIMNLCIWWCSKVSIAELAIKLMGKLEYQRFHFCEKGNLLSIWNEGKSTIFTEEETCWQGKDSCSEELPFIKIFDIISSRGVSQQQKIMDNVNRKRFIKSNIHNVLRIINKVEDFCVPIFWNSARLSHVRKVSHHLKIQRVEI